MKDRLIELRAEAIEKYQTMPFVNGDKVDFDYFLADYLLANGVIVPPCKVGDVVYMVTPKGNIRNLTILSIDIEVKKNEVKMTCMTSYQYMGIPYYMHIQSFNFGDTVFLTKEEAEEKLKELKGNE